MGVANGLHHIAIATRDLKTQLDFFTDVLGGELVSLYWMHGVDRTVHAFVKLGEVAAVAFVQAPETADIEPAIGVSHPGFVAGNVAPGVMQHLAFNLDSEADLMAMRDRIRSRGHWVMGPADHGFCKSIYFVGPEGLMLEFSTWTEHDADEWFDPGVMQHCGLDAGDIARYRKPRAYASQNGTVPQPAPKSGYRFDFPDDWKEKGEALYGMSDEQLCAIFTYTIPPAPKQRKAS